MPATPIAHGQDAPGLAPAVDVDGEGGEGVGEAAVLGGAGAVLVEHFGRGCAVGGEFGGNGFRRRVHREEVVPAIMAFQKADL